LPSFFFQKQVKSKSEESEAVCINGIYSGAFFQDNQGLIDWLNSQKLLTPLFCLGDGHPGIWNLFQEIGHFEQRQEILDWYHLKENLYKVNTTSKQLKKLESLLWSGKVEIALKILKRLKTSESFNFSHYLKRHSERLINYDVYSREQISSIGSGTIESVIKQIGCRVKISGAQWKLENVPRILSLRCAYLNGTFS
jgi:hypothetical protein